MKFSAQEEYGLRCLLTIANQGENGFLTIPEISRVEYLTPSHVAKLLSILRKSGFLKSTRGQAGGYMLARPPSEILVGEVLAALGGRLYDERFCERHSGIRSLCIHKGQCSLSPLWKGVQAAVDSVVSNMTLQELVTYECPNMKVPPANAELESLPVAGS